MSVTQIGLSLAYSIGKEKRAAYFVNDPRLNHVPAPNTHDPIMPDRTSRHTKRPSWSCSKEQRFKNYTKSTPGPGSYEIPSKSAEGFKFSNR